MMAMIQVELTPTQQRLMDILQDGMLHPVAQLWAAIGDEHSVSTNFHVHISLLRVRLQRMGYDVLCDQRNGSSYRLVRHIFDDE